MSKKLEKDSKGVYGLEITTTNACNFRCNYCFEKDQVHKEQLLDSKIIVKRTKELLKAEWFNKQYDGIKIILWGGEPTMNMSLCISLMEAFIDNERVSFFLYTNGSTIHHILPTLKRLKKRKFIKENISKVTVQVSYDGNPTHDMNRKDKRGNPTSDKIKEAISFLHYSGIDYGLKATVSWDDYVFINECWNDYKSLHDIYGSKIKYAVTVDYYNVNFYKHRNQIEDKLIQLAQKEVKFYKKNGYFLSNIFRNNRSFCATGKSMCVINTNGDVLNCHGAIYSKCSNDFKYSNIFNENFINNIQKANKLYENNDIEPEKCIECIATSCLRCNVKKYEESKKETHLDKWFDYTSQKELCDYYRLVGKIGAAIRFIIKE